MAKAKGSKRYELNKEDGLKILKGGGLAMLGALITYAVDILPMIEMGEWKTVIAAVVAILANLGRKLIANNS